MKWVIYKWPKSVADWRVGGRNPFSDSTAGPEARSSSELDKPYSALKLLLSQMKNMKIYVFIETES